MAIVMATMSNKQGAGSLRTVKTHRVPGMCQTQNSCVPNRTKRTWI